MTRRIHARGVALAALALGIAWLPAPACAGDPVKDLVRKVESRYQKTTDLTAEFSQSTDIKGFAKPLQSSGRVELHDVNGNVSTFTFSEILANTGLKDKLFEFTVPQDAEVINAPTLAVP